MKILKFRLWGETAFFKKPDVNTYLYFTYSNIHKVALLGMFGAILGYKGYNQMLKDEEFPEFYEKLKDLKVGIEPKEGSRGNFPKKVQVFNNSVGYASQEQGGNLIVKEQWLENPEWNIYVLINSSEAEELEICIREHRSTFIPYLGKNDHITNIEYIGVYDCQKAEGDIEVIDSLALVKDFEFSDDITDVNYPYRYKENLPISLNKITNMYEYESFIYTNMFIDNIRTEDIYVIEGKNIVFF
ncbi:type I-B CRISPR-associated protein Cas5b [Clostridium sp.]|uniref:type I-B CRISPR-associated protein Cas5b n=1 Tax=Clostridium sp. TaxID=1506 RepID=UPI001B7C33A8|nr:type I-B CRISPR-associated protein Cas5b [Clostridium sp.]MBP3916846.1 type I-B CRISPR-associated protein Cas5 [Clostridium sp.]